MAGGRRRDRRTKSGEFRTDPRSSPASVIVVLLSSLLLATAAATALLGGGFEDATPHGRLLGSLQKVAEAQETHHRRTGEFSAWSEALQVDLPDGASLTVLRGTAAEWEVRVRAPEVGLTCSQGGVWRNGQPVRKQPVCYRDAG